MKAVSEKKFDWKKARLDECFDIQQGKQVSKHNRCGINQRPFLRTANVFWGRLNLSKLDEMNFTTEEEKRLKLQKGDLLVCEGGDVGRTAMWNGELENCYYQNHLHRLRKKDSGINETFALLFLQYAFVYAKLYFGRANITTIPNLSKSRLSELEISLPSVAEQEAIVKTLSKVQAAIAGQEELTAKLKELKRSMMQFLFTYGTKGEKTKITEIDAIPGSWKIVEFENLCVLQRGRDLTKKDFKNGNFPVAGSNGIIGYHDTANLKAPAITVGRSGSVGIVNFYNQDVWAHNTALYVKDFKGNNAKFVAYYLKHLRLDKFKSGVSVPTLDRNHFKTMALALPTINEQKEIANILQSIDEKWEATQNKLSAYQNLFKTLLHELMSGERRIKF